MLLIPLLTFPTLFLRWEKMTDPVGEQINHHYDKQMTGINGSRRNRIRNVINRIRLYVVKYDTMIILPTLTQITSTHLLLVVKLTPPVRWSPVHRGRMLRTGASHRATFYDQRSNCKVDIRVSERSESNYQPHIFWTVFIYKACVILYRSCANKWDACGSRKLALPSERGKTRVLEAD